MEQKILAINSGSSSLKFQLFYMPSEEVIVKGLFERIGSAEGMEFSYTTREEKASKRLQLSNHQEAVNYLLNFLLEKNLLQTLAEISGVGHRVAHGGEYFKGASIVDEAALVEIARLGKLAPLHNPVNLIGIDAFKEALPLATQVAVFDTAFHQTMPEKEYIYPIPFKFYREKQIRRYGFHGTSHQYVGEQAATILDKPLESLKMITCHLGNGASICGIKKGRSQITSMGFTPLAGLMMGTRCGDIDPSILPYLQKEYDLSVAEISRMINEESGLLGVSELTNDTRDILKAAESGNHQAKLALDMFTSRIKQTIGAYVAELGGVDCLVFTAGIGENSPEIRQRVCQGLDYLGICLDEQANQVNQRSIHDKDQSVPVLVIPTNEELMIAQETQRIMMTNK